MKFLFERLVQHDASAPFDLRSAVRDNVQRLVANRVLGDPEDEPDVLNCGLPSVVELGRDATTHAPRYAARVRALVERYEPRLTKPRVEIEAAPLRIVISAALAAADGVEELRFPVASRAGG